MIECLVCGYIGELKKVDLEYRRHWIKGLFLCEKVCPYCGDTAIEKIKKKKNDTTDK